MATGSIGSSGSQLAMDGTARSINCTLAATEYPTQVTFSSIGNGAYWYNNNTSTAKTLTIYLSNSSKSIAYTLGSISIPKASSNTTTKTFTVNCPKIVGAALYIYGSDGACQLRNACSITITTATRPTVSAGSTITKTQMDSLRSFLGKGTAVTQYGTIQASVGTTYKTVSAGTAIDDSWYNTATP